MVNVSRNTMLIAAILGAVCLLLIWVFPAAAQTIDVRPTVMTVADYVVTGLGAVLTVLGGFAIRFITIRIGLDNSKLERDLQERLDFIVHKAMDYALTMAQNEVAKRGAGLSAVKLDNWFVKLAADRVQASAPDILNRLIGRPEDVRARVEAMVIARAPTYFAVTTAAQPVQGGLAATPDVREATRVEGPAQS